jgi:UPF0755 protein
MSGGGPTEPAPNGAKPARRAAARGKDTPKAKPKKRKGLGLLGGFMMTLLVLALLGAAAAGGGYVWLMRQFEQPGPALEAKVLQLAPGLGLNAIAARLESEGLVTSRHLFRAAVTLDGGERGLKAGEYAIPASASMAEIYAMLSEGRVVQYAVTLAEGLTSAMIVASVSQAQVLEGEIAEVPPEGSLLPETYQVVRGTSRQALLDRMAAAQSALIDRLWETRAEGLPFDTKEEAIILASIVEKETGVPEERGRVAAVFVNRLTRGMALESDPTIIYGVSRGEPLVNAAGERRGIRRSELDDATNPYNTYHVRGLPPGPICNPGADSIAAVLNPPPTSDLFFVADGNGGHAFAATLAEHNRNVAAWRRIERERNGQ